MNPKMIQDWIDFENNKSHSMAVRYIEENVDLIDTDLQKFMDNCPNSCKLEVYEMLQKADIDMKGYVTKGSLKQWSNYIHNANQYYTIDYEQKWDECIKEIITWDTDWKSDCIVLDTIPVVTEE